MRVTYLFGSVVYFSMTWIIYGQTTTVSQSGCSYTFLVSKHEDNSCPVGSVATGLHDEEVEYLKSVIKNQQDQLSLLSQNVLTLMDRVEAIRVGTNYVRWGRTVCPQTAQLIYQGLAH